MAELPRNPAPFSDRVLEVIAPMVETERMRLGREPRILDPFAGEGRVHTLGTQTLGVEIEPEWAAWHKRTIVGDSRHLAHLLRRRLLYDMVVTSPTYGNRFADHHDAQERCKNCKGGGRIILLGKKDHVWASRQGLKIKAEVRKRVSTFYVDCPKCDGKGVRVYKRHTYKHYLGRDLTEGNSGGMQWGDEYRSLHIDVWSQLPDVLTDDGLFVLNISDHFRKHERVRVAKWHRDIILGMGGWRVEQTKRVKTPRMLHGQNWESRAEFEYVYAVQAGGVKTGDIRRHDSSLFSPDSIGRAGICGIHNRARGRCDPPVIDYYTERKRKSPAKGFWKALCRYHAHIKGVTDEQIEAVLMQEATP